MRLQIATLVALIASSSVIALPYGGDPFANNRHKVGHPYVDEVMLDARDVGSTVNTITKLPYIANEIRKAIEAGQITNMSQLMEVLGGWHYQLTEVDD